ncbi:DegV family protein [Neomicrococcus lactis]
MTEKNPKTRVPSWLERLRQSRATGPDNSDGPEHPSPRIAVVTDSGASLPSEFVSQHADRLVVVPMPLMIDGQIYAHDPENIERELALALALGKPVKTSRPAPGQFSQIYEELANRGFDGIVSLHLSGELSGTSDAARLAAESARIPVHVIDTRTAGLAEGYLVMDTVDFLENYDDAAFASATSLGQGASDSEPSEDARASSKLQSCESQASATSVPTDVSGASLEAATVADQKNQPSDPVQRAFAGVRALTGSLVPTIDFAVPSLDQLRAGGRISIAASVLGSLLSVKPILNIVDGKLQVRERVRTAPKVFARLLELAVQEAEKQGVPCRFGVQSFGNEEMARQLVRDLEAHTTYPVLLTSVSTVLAAHTGAGVLAICCAPARY